MSESSFPARLGLGLRAAVRALVLAYKRLPRAAQVTTLVIALMLVVGVLLRIWNFGEPSGYSFDEEEFVNNSHSYLMGTLDRNDHPPLAKIIMALGLLSQGFNSTGWRFIPLVFGIHLVMVAFWLGRALFDSRRAGWLAAAFVATDGFYISYSRAALLDGILCCFILWAVLAAVTARSSLGVFFSALLVGLAASVKWSGVMAVIPAVVAVLLIRRVHWVNILFFAMVPVVHWLVWMAGLRLTGQPHNPEAVWELMKSLYRHHLDIVRNTHPFASPWYSWPILYHPIVVKFTDYGLLNRYSSSISNLVYAYTGLVSLALLPICLACAAVSRKLRVRMSGWLTPVFVKGVLILMAGWVALLIPWMVARKGYVFHYHYLPSFGFLLILVAGIVATLERKRPRIAATFVGLSLAVAVFYAPVWADVPISEASANYRLFLPTWRP